MSEVEKILWFFWFAIAAVVFLENYFAEGEEGDIAFHKSILWPLILLAAFFRGGLKYWRGYLK